MMGGNTSTLRREPVRMDNARLISALGQERHTPLDEAVDATLNWLGCFAAFELPRKRTVMV
jgi:nucleoside-diphosphate-sugar epimerase